MCDSSKYKFSEKSPKEQERIKVIYYDGKYRTTIGMYHYNNGRPYITHCDQMMNIFPDDYWTYNLSYVEGAENA